MCRVLIKDLSFRYRAKGDYVLNNLNLAVEEGVPANGAALTAEELSEELCELLRRD